MDTSSDDYLEETVEIHARDFQRYSIDYSVYHIPVDENEEDRLEAQEWVFYSLFNGHPFFPPINYPMKVLDCGYGLGRWAINMAQTYPESEIFAVDIWRPDLDEVPDNLDISFWNLNDPLIRHPDLTPNSFDLIHSRCVGPGIKRSRWGSYVSDLKRLLRRGGWLQMAEFYYNIQSDSGRLRPEHSIHRWGVTYRGLMEGDRDPRAGHSLEQKLRDAGLHDIHTRLFQIPIGDWPTDPGQRAIGIRNLANIDSMLDSHALWPFTHRGANQGGQVQVYTPQQVRWLTDAARQEARDPSLRLYIPLYVVWARKR